MRIKNPEVLARLEELRQNRCPDGTLDDVLAALLVDSSLLEEVMTLLVAREPKRCVDCGYLHGDPVRRTIVIDFGDTPPAPELLDFPRPHGVLEAEGRRRLA